MVDLAGIRKRHADDLAVLAGPSGAEVREYDDGSWEGPADIYDLLEYVTQLETAIVKFDEWVESWIPMPVNPNVGRLMEIGRNIRKSQADTVQDGK